MGLARWQRAPRVAKGLRPWPKDRVIRNSTELLQLYNAGFTGAIYDEAARDQLFGSLEWPDGEDAAAKFGLTNSGVGKLSYPGMYAFTQYPTCWPSPNQTTGDCVSHAGKNNGLVQICVDVVTGTPDAETGKVEGYPTVSPLAEKNGVVACENLYGMRGHMGEGASCDTLIHYATQTGGIMLRQNYPELGINLEKYDASIGIGWGGSGTPANVTAAGHQHPLRTATDCPTHIVARDFLANGYSIWVCSSLGFSSTRDENGFSVQQGSWGHSWMIDGYDDRPEVVQKYGFPLAHFVHDWAMWNHGGTLIMGTDKHIPEGTMWINATLLDKCDCTAMSSINGWPRRDLPSWSLGI